MTEEKRIYSLNLANYLLVARPDARFTTKVDKLNGRVYFVFLDDVTQDVEDYKNNEQLREVLHNFANTKRIIRETQDEEYAQVTNNHVRFI